jgi:hypothetical protein
MEGRAFQAGVIGEMAAVSVALDSFSVKHSREIRAKVW